MSRTRDTDGRRGPMSSTLLPTLPSSHSRVAMDLARHVVDVGLNGKAPERCVLLHPGFIKDANGCDDLAVMSAGGCVGGRTAQRPCASPSPQESRPEPTIRLMRLYALRQ